MKIGKRMTLCIHLVEILRIGEDKTLEEYRLSARSNHESNP